MRAGVFDSGIGGLSVLKSLLEHKLFSEIIYYGDTARVPYGIKDKNTIIRYGIEAVEFFKNFELDIIIVACNTVSAYALDEMREASNIPIIGVVEAGIEATAKKLQDKNSNILITGTKATINSKTYEIGLQNLGYKNLQAKATGLFVPLVEEDIFDGVVLEAVLEYYFKGIKKPDAIILGCTHFPLIADAIKNYFKDSVVLIHSGEAIVDQLQKEFKLTPQIGETELKFFASENPDSLKAVAKKWLQK
ncbi:MAG: glutamate racemase [Sulfurimonas sp.]|jgi:glutamate racemase|nr:glutamate racemase [Sulfurimonadaceae bacterium]